MNYEIHKKTKTQAVVCENYVVKKANTLKPSVNWHNPETINVMVLPVPRVSALSTFIVCSNVKLRNSEETTLCQLL